MNYIHLIHPTTLPSPCAVPRSEPLAALPAADAPTVTAAVAPPKILLLQSPPINPIILPSPFSTPLTTATTSPPHYEELAWPAQQDGALGYKQVGQQGQGGGLLGFIMGKYKSGSSGDAETVKALEYAYQAGRMAEKGEKA
ncbi:hypothetical protein HO173_000537 [Letharia columbiana]|uniref:Uncharacterized protein n=1 Tax=Letharia columbiana TaxID=112416 RepID=A0A8H6LAY7_9LECA|nr:uncharacterized protein HO173_000537 [Letharia columbiana]KAF6241825.1 hypothetical protein HO173_000537 [Letharia columbiana]